MTRTVGYSEFVRLCRVHDVDTWVPWLRVRAEGVYIAVPEGDLLPEERAALTAGHPTQDLTAPALRFPCTLAQLAEFLEAQGCYGCIDAFDMAAFVQSGTVSSTLEAPGPKARNAYLRTIDTLCRALTGTDLTQPKAAELVLSALAKAGLAAPIDKRTLYNYLREARQLRDN